MDKRSTLNKNETFIEILTDCKKNNTKVHLLYEDGGVVRGEGFVKEIKTTNETPFIEFKDGTLILLKTIIAVNGMFDPSYSEC